jgi:hypothetical protein
MEQLLIAANKELQTIHKIAQPFRNMVNQLGVGDEDKGTSMLANIVIVAAIKHNYPTVELTLEVVEIGSRTQMKFGFSDKQNISSVS